MDKDEKAPAYFGNEMNTFNDGVQVSMQFRIAYDFVKSGLEPPDRSIWEVAPEDSARARVEYAYLLAEEMMAQGLCAGYVAPISDSHECNAQTKKFLDRQIDAGLHQNEAQRKAQHELQRGAVAIPMPGQGPMTQ